MRHPGCPIAEFTFQRVLAAAQRRPNETYVVIVHGDSLRAKTWLLKVYPQKLPSNLVIQYDPCRRLYDAWSVPETSIQHFLGIKALAAYGKLLLKGVHNRPGTGSRRQSAAVFWLDDCHQIVQQHFPTHAGDIPSF